VSFCHVTERPSFALADFISRVKDVAEAQAIQIQQQIESGGKVKALLLPGKCLQRAKFHYKKPSGSVGVEALFFRAFLPMMRNSKSPTSSARSWPLSFQNLIESHALGVLFLEPGFRGVLIG
jgi:hypothetical protein